MQELVRSRRTHLAHGRWVLHEVLARLQCKHAFLTLFLPSATTSIRPWAKWEGSLFPINWAFFLSPFPDRPLLSFWTFSFSWIVTFFPSFSRSCDTLCDWLIIYDRNEGYVNHAAWTRLKSASKFDWHQSYWRFYRVLRGVLFHRFSCSVAPEWTNDSDGLHDPALHC